MSVKKRMAALLTSAAMLTAPAASLAEANYYAGELTATAVSDSYVGGKQINLHIDLGANAEQAGSKRMQAAASLLDKSEINVSFYDDFGTQRVRAELLTDGVKLLTADAMIYEDGSVQVMTSLTGKLVLAAPAGTYADGKLNLGKITGEMSIEDLEGADLASLPLRQRLNVTTANLMALLVQHLLGWVSYTQMETGELYVFDDTYLEETDTRDAVAQRMIGTIAADEFNSLLWNIAATVCDTQGDLQQALADLLAKMGVTRQQVRTVVDKLFAEEQIDPSEDYVQTSYAVMQGDPSALCEYDDVSYFFKKLVKSTDHIWEESTDNTMHMTVSYDDYGSMVGFDADAPQFSEVLPYEGFFNYSIKTDENWQRLHIAHGELQVYDDNRVVGDMKMQFGEDVDGRKESYLNGAIDVVDQKDQSAIGLGLTSSLCYEVGEDDTETISGNISLAAREQETELNEISLIDTSVFGKTALTEDGFTLEGEILMKAAGLPEVSAQVTLASGEYEESPFAGGQAIDLANLNEDQLETIRGEVIGQAAKIMPSLVTHPGVLADVLALLSKE